MSFESGIILSIGWLIACWYVRYNAYDRGYGHGYIKGVQDGYQDGKRSTIEKYEHPVDDDGRPLNPPDPIPVLDK